MKILKVLAVCVVVAMAGCGGPQVDMAKLEGKVQGLAKQRANGRGVSEVSMAHAEGNTWKGYVKYSDGATEDVTAIVDIPNNKSVITFD